MAAGFKVQKPVSPSALKIAIPTRDRGDGYPSGQKAPEKPAVPVGKPAKTLVDLKAELDALKGKAGGKKARERLKREIKKSKPEEKKQPAELPNEPASAESEEAAHSTSAPDVQHLATQPEEPPTSSPEAEKGEVPSEVGIEPEPFIHTSPEDLTLDQVDEVIGVFQHNADIVLGSGDHDGLISMELQRVQVQIDGQIEGLLKKAEYEIGTGLKRVMAEGLRAISRSSESQAVAKAIREENTAVELAVSEERKREKYLERFGLNLSKNESGEYIDETQTLKNFAIFDEMVCAIRAEIGVGKTEAIGVKDRNKKLGELDEGKRAELFTKLEELAQKAGIDAVLQGNLMGLVSNLDVTTTVNPAFAPWRKTEHGGTADNTVSGKKQKQKIQFTGRRALEDQLQKAQTKLAMARKDEIAAKVKRGKIKDIPSELQNLLNYSDELTVAAGWVREHYVPDEEKLKVCIADRDTNRTAKDEIQIMIDSQAAVNKRRKGTGQKTYKYDVNVLKDRNRLNDSITELNSRLAEIIDPEKRLLDVNSPLEYAVQLASRVEKDKTPLGSLSPQDRFRIAMARTLVGPPEKAMSSMKLVSEPPTPSTSKPPESPPGAGAPTPAAEMRTVGQMTKAELQTLGYEGIVAVAGELSSAQVADLPLETRLKLMKEGRISDYQYNRVPEVPEIVAQVNALLQMPREEMEQALKSAYERVKDDPEDLEQFRMVEEELRAKLGGAYSKDKRKIPQSDADRRADLEEKAKSSDKDISEKARGALKVLAAAGLIAMMSTGGGEEH